jgi:hypothetical protein
MNQGYDSFVLEDGPGIPERIKRAVMDEMDDNQSYISCS